MTTIYHVTEPEKPFVYLSNPPALHNIANEIGAELVVYPLQQFAHRHIDADHSNEAIWFIEAAYPQMSGMGMKELRRFAPNGKLVVLGGDTVWFVRRNEHHVQDPHEVDLWLDLMDEVVCLYRNMGINADSWMWTVTQTLLDQCEEYTQNLPVNFDAKEFDFVSLITVSTDYRRALVEYFKSKNKSFVMGVNCTAQNIPAMVEVYRKSWFHLGTTSPSWTKGIRTMKGFRDWLAPALNTLLIYDNHSDIMSKYGGGAIVPLYSYNSFESADYLMWLLREDKERYEYILKHQKLWVSHNTLEKQFMRKLKLHNILPTQTPAEKEADSELSTV
jgi:hypothetical protein